MNMYEKPQTNSVSLLDQFLPYVEGYLDKSLPQISNLANFSSLVFDFFDQVNWAGFYLYDGEKLFLGPFQGKPACTSIELGKGVCGTAAIQKKTILVPDTDLFPGHIVCDGDSRSEIVIPIFVHEKLFGVLDIDSPILDRFHPKDQQLLERAVHLLIDILS